MPPADGASKQTHLALLPPPPWPVTQEALQVAYREPLKSLLEGLSESVRQQSAGVSVDVVLPLPWLHEKGSKARSSFFKATQAAVAGVYKLVCVIAAKHSINVEDDDGIDVRIILLDHARKAPKPEPFDGKLDHRLGPVIDIHTLAASGRRWASVFSVESEQGESLLKHFLLDQDRRVKFRKLPGGIVQTETSAGIDAVAEEVDARHHHRIILGGTWDHIHIGHKLLLTMFAFLAVSSEAAEGRPRELFIGTTGDELLKNKKHPELLQSWGERQKSTLSFLRAILDFRPPAEATLESDEVNNPGPNGHAIQVELDQSLIIKFVEIWDPFGPTITEPGLTALVVSAETRGGGKAVNDKRRDKGWPALQVFEVNVLDSKEASGDQSFGENFESKLSSTAIRQALSEKARIKSKA